MKKAIIHISDLHVSQHKDIKDQLLHPNSWLTTDLDSNRSTLYIENFTAYMKSRFSDTEFYLVITGDIANAAEEDEYDCAKGFINKILTDLNITKQNVLLVPGDHDVHWESCRNAYRQAKQNGQFKEPHLYNSEKYCNFEKFYSEILEKPFPIETSLIDIIDIESEQILLVGLNSNYRIDFDGGNGEIDIQSLRIELEKINEKYINYSKIAACHHNLNANYENKAIGQWDQANRVAVVNILEEFNFKSIFLGNEHTRASESLNILSYSEAGAFASKENPFGSFKVYEIEDKPDSKKLNLKLITMQTASKLAESPWGAWGIQDNKDLNELENITLIQKQSNPIDQIEFLEILETELTKAEDNSPCYEDIIKVYSKEYYRSRFLEIIRSESLFHSGHFHWSKSSRAHNWIDVSKFLNKNENLSLAKNSLVDVIETCNLENQFDFIIALGNEGNMIGTRLSVKYNRPYSFLPYSYRYDDHATYEKELNFKNDGKYKSVLIITDVVHDGRTIRKLINKREKNFFEKVKKIIVISLFYTGSQETINIKMMNSSNKSLNGDHAENRIEYYFVMPLYVEPCPYNENYETDCIVVREGLGCIHKFYNDGD